MADEKKTTGGAQVGASKVAAVAGAPAPSQPGPLKLDPEQFKALQRTLVVAGLAAGLAFRRDIGVGRVDLGKLADKADVLVGALLGD